MPPRGVRGVVDDSVGRGAETRQRILDAAEALFAAQGVASTSLRAIIAAAGVNSAAIHYHFGSKEALIGAFFARRIQPINDARLERLDALEASGTLDHESLLRAFLEPLLGDREPGTSMGWTAGGALARLLIEEPESFRELAQSHIANVRGRFAGALANTTPGLGVEEATERIQYAMGAMLHAFARPNAARESTERNDVHDRMDRLITFLAAGFASPPASESSAPSPRDSQ